MLHYPQLDPVAFHLGPLAVHWYGLMYLLAFAAAWGMAYKRRESARPVWTTDELSDLIFYAALGAILGGRIGYTLIYNWSQFAADPLVLVRIWDGGMSFHGGVMGVIAAIFWFARRVQRHWADVFDFLVPLVPMGLGLGRLGNFINGELMGRVSDVPWAMLYPNGGMLPRHPSPLYEFLFEGVLLFVIIAWYSSKPRPRLAVSGLFLLGYACFRFLLEFFRQPDPQLGFIAWDWLTMGQLLSLPMALLGVFILYWSHTRNGC